MSRVPSVGDARFATFARAAAGTVTQRFGLAPGPPAVSALARRVQTRRRKGGAMEVQADAGTTGGRAPGWLIADGEMGRRVAEHPWSSTSLGALSSWPTSLRTMVNVVLATPVPMVILWGDELVLIYNDAYRSISVERHPDAFGRPAREAWADLHDFVDPIFSRLRDGGDAVSFTDRPFRVRRDGAVTDAWFTVAYSAIRDVAARTLGLLLVVQETTRYIVAERQLQENQQLLVDIVDSTPEIIFSLDRDQRYLLVNRELATFVGLPKERILGQPVRALFPPETGEALVRTNVEILRNGTTNVSELLLKPLRGTAKTLLVTKFPIRNASGEITGLGGVAVDISARKALEEDLLAQKSRAEASVRLKAAFLDIAAHELRNPITVLSLLLQLYQDATRDGGTVAGTDLARLREPVDRLSRLVVELLDAARLERGMVVLQRADIDLGHLLRRCVDEFRLLAPQRELRLLLPAEPVRIAADPIRLHQVFGNLLDNAIKYAPTGSIDVSVEALPASLRIAIVDHGPGIAAGSFDELFEAFARGRAEAVLSRPSGLGLGLSLCRSIVTLHGGTIDVQTTSGGGTTFIVELPREVP
jgi:PAS domain S-box-containing protein